MMVACSLLPLASPSSWIFSVLLCVCLQSGVGAAARRVPLARPLTVLAQALVSLLALTVIFAPHQALGGVIPGPQAFRQLGTLIQGGMADVGNFAIPAPVTPGIRILLVGGVLVIALAVDATAVTYNSAAPAGLPLLALYSVAAGLASGGTQWLYFLVAAAGYLLLLLAEGRDRLSRWGRVFGSAPPPNSWAGGSASTAGGSATAPVRTGRRIGAMALGIALIAPAMLPSLGGGLLKNTGNGSATGGGGGSGASAVNLVAALQDNLNQPDDHVVLTYKTDSSDPTGMYLRIAALDKFNGSEWSPSNRPTEDIPSVLPQPQGQAAQVKYKPVTTNITADDSYRQELLPMPFPAMSVQAPGDWRFQPEGRMVVGQGGQTVSGERYIVTSMQLQPTAAQLAAAPPATGQIAADYTQVPSSLPPVVAQTAKSVTRSATNDYQRALALQRFFTSGQFVYNVQAKSGTGVDAIARFLQTKEGFCVHFAFTMAAMARTLHIPARVAIGFTPGTQNAAGAMSVGLKDAHAWPELYFEGIGWTRFEPTPYRGTAPSYTQDTPAATGGGRTDTPSHGATAAPQPTSSAATSCAPENRAPSGACAGVAASGGGPHGGGVSLGWLLLAAMAFLLVVLLLTAPAFWRSRVRAGRLDGASAAAEELALSARSSGGSGGKAEAPPPGGGRPRAAGAALSAWREVVDTAWDYGILPDDSETPRKAATRLVRDGGLTGRAEEAVGALATAVEQALYAPEPRPAPGLAAEVHRVRDGLRQAAGRRTRLRALLLPRSSVRLLWSLSGRWTAGTQRLALAGRRVSDPVRRRLTREAPSSS
jgi:transglutaminase-like putative cysteine protease